METGSFSRSALVAITTGPLLMLGSLSAAAAEPGESSKDILAVHIRDQGFKCDSASMAERVEAASKPNEAVWILTCEDATYRVSLVPDMAARVERLPDEGDKDINK